MYKDVDIYLLDDPLSAVDTIVGYQLFNDCICNFLQGKTRLLVTHQMQYLHIADNIVILNEVSNYCIYNILSKKCYSLSTENSTH